MKPINIIVAFDTRYGISRGGKIPWYIKEDFRKFREITTGKHTDPNMINCVLYGRKTFTDIGKLLPNRYNIIISSTISDEKLDHIDSNKYEIHKTIKDGINSANMNPNIKEIFICGGSQIYKEAIKTLTISTFYITVVNMNYDCDNIFMYDQVNWSKYYTHKEEKGIICSYIEKKLI